MIAKKSGIIETCEVVEQIVGYLALPNLRLEQLVSKDASANFGTIKRIKLISWLFPLYESKVRAFPCRLVFYTENERGDTRRYSTAQK